MIKKLQALRAKKGFTLVELVVVIAIIGVLAAILVPTMMNVVQDANISSANTTAKQIRDFATTFLTKASNAGESIRGTQDGVVLECVVGEDGSEGGGEGGGDSATTVPWQITGDGVTFGGDEKFKLEGGENPDNQMDAYLASSLRDFKRGRANIYIQEGVVVGVAVVAGSTTDSDIPSDITCAVFNSATPEITWVGNKAGLASDGVIVGTNPQVAHAAG